MGQKVHPNSLRVGLIHNWKSVWFFKNKGMVADLILEDHKIRKFLFKNYKSSMIADVIIERKSQKLVIKILSARTGVLIGRGGQNLDKLRQQLVALLNKKDIQIDILEVNKPDANAQLIADSIAQQLEKRVAFRRAIKSAMQKAMRAGAKGIKVMVAGRLGGAEIARTEWAKEGRVPLHTFRADIEYGFAEAQTVFGIIGVKCWIFKGEIMDAKPAPTLKTLSQPKPSSNQGGQGAKEQRGPRRGGGGGRRSAQGGASQPASS